MGFKAEDLAKELRKIKPEDGEGIVDQMAVAIYEWVKTATVNVTVKVPDNIEVQIDLSTGHGRTVSTATAEGEGVIE